ncbi:helix-turn-helix domain-containing protein [Klebsiella pneumoniae]
MKAHLQVIFTLDELAAYLKVGKRTLYRLAAHGEIPAFRWAGRGGFLKVKSISGSMIRPEPQQRRR